MHVRYSRSRSHGSCRASWSVTVILLIIGTLLLGLLPLSEVKAAGVVGNGTPESCTEGALESALAEGGLITFNCGASPVIIPVISNTRIISMDTVIDGGNLITIDAQHLANVFFFQGSGDFTMRNMTIINGGRADGMETVLLDGSGTLNIANVTFTESSSGKSGAVIYNNSSGTINITDSVFTNNATSGQGAAVFNASSATVNVENSTFSDNSASDDGGAIYNSGTLNVTDSIFLRNSADSIGGAIASSGTLQVSNSIFSDNSADNGGGGGAIATHSGTATVSTSTFTGNRGGQGGAIVAQMSTVDIIGNTFVNNTAQYSGGAVDTNGEGIVHIANSTFHNNTAIQGYGGGSSTHDGTTTISNSSFSSNSAAATDNPGGTGGNVGKVMGSVTVRNTIIANSLSGGNCSSGITDGGNNIQFPDTSCPETIPSVDPQIAPLADNGGPTETFALREGSPAVNAGDDTVCTAAPVSNVDQRGVVRPQGTTCDIGAFELEQTASTISGQVIDDSGSGVSGVTISAGGTSITTASDGTYTLNGLAEGTYTVNASKADCTFSPSSRSVSVPPDATGQDFTATCTRATYTISGRVLDANDHPLEGVKIALSTGPFRYTRSDGTYTFRNLEEGTYAVAPYKENYTFSPADQVVTVPPDQTAVDFRGTSRNSRYIDLTISLYRNPSSSERTAYERILEYFADGVYEASNGAHQIRNIRIYTNRANFDRADVQWIESCWPNAHISGYDHEGWRVEMCDVFRSHNFLSSDADQRDGGYVLAHEWGHYFYSLRDEYRKRGKPCNGSPWQGPCADDIPVENSIMNSQWEARNGDYSWLNFSTPLNNTRRTSQHRTYLASGWETLARPVSEDPREGERARLVERIYHPELAAVAPASGEAPRIDLVSGHSARDTLNVLWDPAGFPTVQAAPINSYAFVIDVSAEMAAANNLDEAKAAAQWMIEHATIGTDAVSIIAYDGTATMVQPVTLIDSEATRDALIAQLAALQVGDDSATPTAALRSALDAFTTSSNASGVRSTFLFTSGSHQGSTPSFEVIADYQDAGIPIFTFDYGADARTATFGHTLAGETGGTSYAVTSFADAVLALTAAQAESTPIVESAITQGQAAVASATTETVPFVVDSSLSALEVVAIQPATDAATLTLRDPAGSTGGTQTCSTVQTYHVCSLQVDASALVSGTWALQMQAAAASVDVVYRVQGRTQDAVPLFADVAIELEQVIAYPDVIEIDARLHAAAPIARAVVNAEITLPDGTTQPFTIRDDGVAPDALADDGTYSALLDQRQNGLYTVVVQFDNSAGTAAQTYEGLALAPPDGDDVPTPDPVPVGENFERIATTHLYMTDVQSDDHGNTVQQATELIAANTDLPGRIETAGDTDVFAVTAAESGVLVVRVSNLAFAMEPRLRLLAADGTTERASVTWSGSGYLWVSVPVQAGETLYAEVTHLDTTADMGIYEISAGSPLDGESSLTAAERVYLPLIQR